MMRVPRHAAGVFMLILDAAHVVLPALLDCHTGDCDRPAGGKPPRLRRPGFMRDMISRG